VKLPDGTIERRNAVELPSRLDQQIQSWDMAFKGTQNSDYVVGQVQAAYGANRFVLDQIREHLDLPGTLLAVRRLSAQWPDANLKLVEDKANGPAVIQSPLASVLSFPQCRHFCRTPWQSAFPFCW